MNYIEKLRKSAEETGSIACMGLDPVIETMPGGFADPRRIPHFLKELFAEMIEQKVLAGAFKPNQGFYFRHDEPLEGNGGDPGFYEGSTALARVIKTIRAQFDGVPITLDYKRGDIAKSSDNYAVEGFGVWKADAVTVPPYMGYDSVLPFAGRNPKDLEQPARYCNDGAGKGVYVLVRTSNPGAKDFQDLEVIVKEERMPLYMAVAHKVVDWARDNPGIGTVVGATYLKELDAIARLIVESGVDVPLLIPGTGKKSEGGQGGDASEVVTVLREAGYPLPLARVSSSSGITHPWAKKKTEAPDDYAKVCVASLARLNELINFKAA
jgi:orotidine-5'-phosphate decarboxylase